MPHTKFQKIIIIGYGRITAEVLRHICEQRPAYGYEVECIEHEIHPFSAAGRVCEEYGIPFHSIPDRRELTARLLGTQEETLIVSAGNHFLFPGELVKKRGITIVNFHNALLPKYPGRNAPSWAIFEGEKETGITWHYVTEGVDEGGIILQKSCRIGPDTRAYELTEELMTLAREGFCECFQGILEESCEVRQQEWEPGRRVYKAREVPGGGRFDTQDPPADIYRLLRAMDYGKNPVFPEIRAVHEGREIRVVRYRKIPKEKKGTGEEGFLYLPLDRENLLKIRFDKA